MLCIDFPPDEYMHLGNEIHNAAIEHYVKKKSTSRVEGIG